MSDHGRGFPFIDLGLRCSALLELVEGDRVAPTRCFNRSKLSIFAVKAIAGLFGVEGRFVDGPASTSDISIDSFRFAIKIWKGSILDN
jgi:hypothetical protein